MEPISFGTDGWRAVIADGFTFDRVRQVSRAIAVAAGGLEPPAGIDRDSLVVGYDRRFLSREFAVAAAEELAASGYRVLLSDQPVPSQTVSFTAFHRRLLGGVVITASHNPAAYNGVKFKGWYGGSALPPMYAAIAASLGEERRREGGSIVEVDLLADYEAALRSFLQIDLLRRSSLRLLHDPLHGAAAGVVSRVLEGGSATVEVSRGETNPGFGGVNPEPIPENLRASIEVMRSGGFDLAICNDGDADRLGILDGRGEFVSPHKVIALLALYLVRDRGSNGDLVKTFSTTRLIETIARALGARLHETPIGFKYVADLMLQGRVLLGGEESGGIGFGAFLPERDGILSGLVVAECVAARGRPLATIVDEMEEEFGRLHYDRRDVHRSFEACERLIDRARRGELDRLMPSPVATREEKDGVKLNFEDGGWLLFRKSGTEPMIRIYCESPVREQVREMLEIAVRELDR